MTATQAKETTMPAYEKTMQEMADDLPSGFPMEANNPVDLVWEAQIELDLIEEGQEAAENYTKRDVTKLRKFLKKWGHLMDATA